LKPSNKNDFPYDFENLKELRAAKMEEANAPVAPLSLVRKELKI
jgi:hypothetical protein